MVSQVLYQSLCFFMKASPVQNGFVLVLFVLQKTKPNRCKDIETFWKNKFTASTNNTILDITPFIVSYIIFEYLFLWILSPYLILIKNRIWKVDTFHNSFKKRGIFFEGEGDCLIFLFSLSNIFLNRSLYVSVNRYKTESIVKASTSQITQLQHSFRLKSYIYICCLHSLHTLSTLSLVHAAHLKLNAEPFEHILIQYCFKLLFISMVLVFVHL